MKLKIIGAISLLNKEQKKKFNLITFSFIMGSLLETFTVYILYLSFKLFSNYNSFIEEEPKIVNIFNFFGFKQDNLIIYLSLFLLLIYLIKFLFLSKLYFYLFKFINDLNVNLSTKMLHKYLYSDFEFHSYQENSKLLRNIKDEATLFCTGLIQQSILLFNEIITFLFILILVGFIVTKKLLVVLLSLAVVSTIYYLLIKPIYKKQGSIRQNLTNLMIKFTINSLQAIKDIKIFKAEKHFLKKFNKSITKLAHAVSITTTLNQIPRIGLELFVVAVFSIYIFYNYNGEIIDINLLAPIGLLIITAFKLIPSISKIINFLNGIKFSSPTLEIIQNEINNNYEILDIDEKKIINKKLFGKSIKLKDLSFKYKNRNDYLFQNLNLEFKKNTTIGIIGQSGSGKSTFVDILIGLHKPSSGDIYIDDINLKNIYSEWLEIVGYVPQKVFILDESIKNNIAIGVKDEDIDIKKINKVIKECSLEFFIDGLAEGLETKLAEGGKSISGGEDQRIGIARALYKDTDLIILDEITSSLDKLNETKIMNIIKKISLTKTIIIISHKEEILDFCDQILEAKNGKILKKK